MTLTFQYEIVIQEAFQSPRGAFLAGKTHASRREAMPRANRHLSCGYSARRALASTETMLSTKLRGYTFF